MVYKQNRISEHLNNVLSRAIHQSNSCPVHHEQDASLNGTYFTGQNYHNVTVS